MFDNLGDFGLLINALGGGGNKGNAFPEIVVAEEDHELVIYDLAKAELFVAGLLFDDPAMLDDAIDLRNGATYIPHEVTETRREGKEVVFIQIGEKKDWYWQMPDGTKVK